MDVYQDKIRGCLIGGAAGDALGSPVEFLCEEDIYLRYGDNGICQYDLDQSSGKALVSDDTQMTLFTANGLLLGDTRGRMRGIRALPRCYVADAYQDWLCTQEMSFEESRQRVCAPMSRNVSWLSDVPELYSRRAPGNTCISALEHLRNEEMTIIDHLKVPKNDSKGCGGVMRVAPLALPEYRVSVDTLDREGAQIAAITHGHSLGYMPAAVLTHIIRKEKYAKEGDSLKEIVLEAINTIEKIFENDKNIQKLTDILTLAIRLSENDAADLDNIHQIGEGWVAEETLAIAIYCALRHQDDFSTGIIASVNHRGDSDSTGAVTGNILGAWLGLEAIDEKWKKDLELYDVILEMADDLYHGCQISEYSDRRDADWERKYIYARWRE